MRKMRSWSKAPERVWLSSRAEARSRPNGFSTTRRLRSARPDSRSPSITDGKIDGGIAR